MNSKQNKYLDSGMTNLLVFFLFVYAFVVCYCCYMVLSDQIDFGVVGSTNSEIVWRVSQQAYIS